MQNTDPYLWLEEVEGEKALNWVKERNKETLTHLESDSRFESLQKEIYKIVASDDRISMVAERDEFYYNFWQDENIIRGQWRRCKKQDYFENKNPSWEVLLDIDELAEKENENWVWKGSVPNKKNQSFCMLGLSRGGKDACEYREFDVEKKQFVKNGFFLPEAKQSVSWIENDRLLVGSANDELGCTDSGYSRVMRILKRGDKYSDAKLIFESDKKSMGVWAFELCNGTKSFSFFSTRPTFWEAEVYYLDASNDMIFKIPIPLQADMIGIFKDQIILELEVDWEIGGLKFNEGSVVSFSMSEFEKTKKINDAFLIFEPADNMAAGQVAICKDHLLVSYLEDVSGRLNCFQFDEKDNWKGAVLSVPDHSSLTLDSSSPLSDDLLYTYRNFTSPPTQVHLNLVRMQTNVVRKTSDQFESTDVVVEQKFSKSSDGKKIPYYFIHKKDIELNGNNPTILYGYGGFKSPLTPEYLASAGKAWLEKGGVYIFSNIRGGGEYGPQWHKSVLKENRQKVFDDFISIGEKLIADKVTSPQRLAIMGGSNGGLLVGAVTTQRPELFNAVVCQVPLLDMLRYHKLLAGASWVAEYGDPDIAEERSYIEKYSPYQNLKAEVEYPEIFFVTSTKDDRVHPGHARKMAAKMQEFNKKFSYFENIDGGHAAGANLKEAAKRRTLEFIFLYQKIFD